MPKLGMEPIRKAALVEATIYEIGSAGSLDVTVSQIARRAGMSPALAHHYFGNKDQIFLAAMRHLLTLYAAEVRGALAIAQTPEDRLKGMISASFSPVNFRCEVVSAWLNFYVLAQSSVGAQKLLRVYQNRLRSNMIYELRPLVGAAAPDVAERLASLIDGLYLREALGRADASGPLAINHVLTALHLELKAYK